jgi:hypothetical protein
MRAMSATAGEKAKSGTAMYCEQTRSGLRAVDAVRLVARALWKTKPAANLAARSGSSMRACEYWLARQGDMSADALANLLRSDAGFEILEKIMGSAKPVWWKQFKIAKQLGAMRQENAEIKRKAAEHDDLIAQFEMKL